GAFVCGEETALLASIEGERGIPRKRPPFPVTSGLGGFPTLINNVETFACVPVIVDDNGHTFKAIGTTTSHGTKAFALAGKVKQGGLIEVPIGITIADIVETFGGGAEDGHQIKAVMIGGPSGGCIPSHRFDLPVDYETLQQSGAMMGSGGLIVLDERDCMVDLSLYYLRFVKDESCGKCVPCREGIIRLCELMEQLIGDQEKAPDLLEQITSLAKHIQQGSLCALGRTAPNMVLSAMHEFKDEFIAHLHGCCPSGKCTELTTFQVTDDCIGCTKCAQVCAVDAIEVTPLEHADILQDACGKCGVCRTICPEGAITCIATIPAIHDCINETNQTSASTLSVSRRTVNSQSIEVNGQQYPYVAGKTLLDYAEENASTIPTLCHLKDSNQTAHCMVCAAWDQTLARFVPSCEQLVEQGHVYQTDSPNVHAFRQQALGLMLNRHDFQCRECNINGQCSFLSLLGKHRVKKKKSNQSYPDKVEAKYITFDAGKCILCHRCLAVSNQEITVQHRGGQSCISPVPGSWNHISKATAQFIANVCPTGALSQRND
ncbi:MAG: NADH-ubiquinone oxidoreductase-F iron-sulfur binding region domain-containing protein, partial [Phycisphaeraceae bacterium JB051]